MDPLPGESVADPVAPEPAPSPSTTSELLPPDASVAFASVPLSLACSLQAGHTARSKAPSAAFEALPVKPLLFRALIIVHSQKASLRLVSNFLARVGRLVGLKSEGRSRRLTTDHLVRVQNARQPDRVDF